MPELITTPWIRGAQPAEFYTKGLAIGAQQAEANQRAALQAAALLAEQERAMMESDIRSRQIEKQFFIDQQKNEIEKAYRQAEVGMAAAKLAEEKCKNDLEMAQWMRLQQAQAGYDSDFASLFKQYKDEGQDDRTASANAAMRAALKNQLISPTGAGAASMAKAALSSQATIPPGGYEAPPLIDPNTGKPIPGTAVLPGAGGQPNLKTFKTPKEELQDAQLKSALEAINSTEASILNYNMTGRQLKAAKDRIAKLQELVNSIYKSRGVEPMFPDAGTSEGWTQKGGFKVKQIK